MRSVVEAALEAGATHVSPIMLHLRPGVREQFMPWLEEHHPDLVERYRRLYPKAYASAEERRTLGRRVGDLVASVRARHPDRAGSPPRHQRFQGGTRKHQVPTAVQPSLFER